jgi:hypothetical protein
MGNSVENNLPRGRLTSLNRPKKDVSRYIAIGGFFRPSRDGRG